ncbi:MAG: hypothetical protein ACE37H_16695 [Phycisphaeraceae bacterium]
MPAIPPPPVPTQLIVFADDWGRHPSSSQHLIRELLPQYPTLWVNTVGTRWPSLSVADIRKGLRKLKEMIDTPDDVGESLPEGLRVIQPVMYPGFRKRWQRRINRHQVKRTILDALNQTFTTAPRFGNKSDPPRRVAITTLPITADLVGMPGIDRWVYYCVDDYSQWPGTDHAVMDAMERELASKVDAAVAVSDALIERLASFGVPAGRLDHGVDLDAWSTPNVQTRLPESWPDERKPIALFWGLIDSRTEHAWVNQLADVGGCAVVMAGPHTHDCSPSLWSYANMLGPVDQHDLPAYAAASDVLIMPYIDAPVTRAMQPLKLKEYLATMKPVVVRDLPSTRPWADCCDLAISPGGFTDLVRQRAGTGILPEQRAARERRLPAESWSAKAAQLAELINAG